MTKRATLMELEAVTAVARRRSFRAAARELSLSPSALSHAVSALEARLGVRLFHRTTRSVTLTAAGEQLTARLDPALREIAGTLASLDELRDTPSGLLRLTTSREGGLRHVLPLVLELRRRHPAVQVELDTSSRLVDIVADGFDAGVRLAEAVPQDMIAVPLGPDLAMAVVGAPSYLAGTKRPRTPADLAQHECIRLRTGRGAVYRWELEKRGREVNVDVPGSLVLDDDALVREAALQGAGLAYVSEPSVREHLASGRLVRLLEDWTPPYPGLRLCHPSHRLVRPALRAFLEIVRESHPPKRKR